MLQNFIVYDRIRWYGKMGRLVDGMLIIHKTWREKEKQQIPPKTKTNKIF